ncbi:MAG: c-type cytochrome [Endozoicomonas sp. (ex Botrylloides leachii)]|nr:c-type cytochrome [Endozoicomonas sp. (ex Botrylloides leachii)]
MPRLFLIRIRALLCLLATICTATATAKLAIDLDERSRREIAERIAPIGRVCEAGQLCAKNAFTAVKSDNGTRSGEQVVSQFCSACHTTGLLNAPKIGDGAAWSKYMQAAGGFNQMLTNAINGIGAMPPKGTCMDCSDIEIQSAIEHMSGLKP